MGLKGLTALLLGILYSFNASAQQGELTQSRILILLDGSSSMTESWAGGKKKFKAAEELILRLMDSVYAVNGDVEFSLRVFGHQHTVEENYCLDTKNEVPFAKRNRTRMALRLEAIHPLGVTPIAFALKEAAEQDLMDEVHNAYSIILITDGGESCGGDICEVMQRLIKRKIIFKPYIVSLEADPALKTTYSCMGDYLQVTQSEDMPRAVGTIVEAFRPVLKITATDYKDLQIKAAKTPGDSKVNVTPVKKDTVSLPNPVKTFKTDTLKPKQDTIVFTRPEPEKIVRDPVEKMKKIILIKLKPFTLYTEYGTETSDLKPIKPDATLPPVVTEEPQPESKEKIGKIALAMAMPVKINSVPFSSGTVNMKVPEIAFPLPPIANDAPAAIIKDKIGRPVLQKQIQFETPMAPTTALKNYEPDMVIPPVVIELPVEPKTIKIARLKPAPAKMQNVFFVIEDKPLPEHNVPPLLEADIVKADKGLYTTTVEDAKETTLEVLFTNGKGKYYPSTPQVFLSDPATNKVVKKFYRTVDASGNPDPQTSMPAGNFDFSFSAKKDFIVHGVHIEEGKKNKLVIKVKNTSLSFYYIGAPGRPVSEFTAVVTERNKAQGRVQTQKCTEAMEYEPGNYHIEINTFPKDIRNLDLDFDFESGIGIPQPGFAKFTAQGSASSVSLYQRLGDKFLNFYSMDLADPRSKHLNMQPGEYQAHYQKPAPKGGGSEQVVQFVIKANQETEVILK